MRVSIPVKIFAAFLSVFLVSALMALSVWYGFRGLNKTSGELEALKNFQLSLMGLELFNFGPEMRSQEDRKTRLDKKFEDLKVKTAVLKAILETMPPETTEELPLLEVQLEYFRKAYHELLVMQDEDEVLHHLQHELMEALALKLKDPDSDNLRNEFSSMLYYWGRAYHDRDVVSISGLNRLIDATRNKTRNPATRDLLDEIEKSLAKNYLNYLAMVEREEFLAGTTLRYVQLSNQAIKSVEEYETGRQSRLTGLMAGALLLSLALTVLYWIRVSAYVSSYLKKSGDLVDSIQHGKITQDETRNPDDEFGDMLGFIREMGVNLKKTMESVRASEEKYRTLVEEMDDWVWETGPDGNCVYSGPAGSKMLSVPEKEILGKPIAGLICPTQVCAENSRCLMLLADGKSASGVLSRTQSSDGKTIALESAWRAHDDGTGKSGLRGITRNVTERLALEAERSEMQLQLMHAQKMEAIGTLSGGVAHDFNNLLQSIGGYADILLKRGNLAEKDRDTVKLLANTAVSASRLTKQLLLFSSRVETKMEPVDLNDCITRVQTLLARLIPKETALVAELESSLPGILADQTQMEQVLMNLIINASDAINGRGKITLTTRSVTDNPSGRGVVILSVQDTGKGMEQGIIERMFEPFFTTKEAGKGTGLGLAIVYGITKSHNGEITCKSEPSKGTLFEISFPATNQKPVKPITEIERATGKEPPSTLKTILLVDDEASIRETSREMLNLEGYNTLTAGSGEEALEIYSRTDHPPIDVIILDISMPGMGGEACYRKLRIINPDQKIILASGYPDLVTLENENGKGVDAFLKKPFRMRTLIETLKSVST